MIATLLLCCWIWNMMSRTVHAANWAQVNGPAASKVAIVHAPPWSNRWGHAVAALDYTQEHMDSTGQKSRMFIIGGDDQMQTSVLNEEDLKPYPGGGGYKNDVWWTTGWEWKIVLNPLKTTKWGDPLPQQIADISWIQSNRGKSPPRGVAYSSWIECGMAPWTSANITGCDDITTAPGKFFADLMFSPRRNFVSINFKDEIYVMGGRARELEQIPEDETRGGLIGPRMPRWRELTVLKNDIWKTSDAGTSWTLVNPGCVMPQESLLYKSGDHQYQCTADSQCDGDSTCKYLQEIDGVRVGSCICNVWSAREHHAVAVHRDHMYIAGGYTFLQLSLCGTEKQDGAHLGEYACGGRYRGMMNDVWRSSNGKDWELMTALAGWSPRGELALASLNGLLYVLGGRQGTSGKEETELKNDIWSSTTGSDWTAVTLAAPWSPRARHRVVVAPREGTDFNELVLVAGEDAEVMLDEAWTWDGSTWLLDFGAESETKDYVTQDSDLSMLHAIPPNEIEILNQAGIFTITDLGGTTLETNLILRQELPFCDYRAIALQVLAQCSLPKWNEYDGKEFEDVHIIQGRFGLENYQKTLAAEAKLLVKNWDGCTHMGTQVYNDETEKMEWPKINGYAQVQEISDPFTIAQSLICKWVPEPRTSFDAILFQGKIFLMGGRTNKGIYSNALWYRDAVLPKAEFITFPAPFSSDTSLTFVSDEPGCIFEYHVFDTVEHLVIRNWTKSLGELDFITWMDGGRHRIRIRAIDPAGNVDAEFVDGINEYTWVYVPVLPWGLIIGLSITFALIMVAVIIEWRRRRKKAAMERYAMKRMRRKLKGAKKAGNKDVNWRKDYDKGKDGKKKKKKKKDGKDKDDKDGKKKKKKKDKDKDGKKKDKKKDKTKEGSKSAKVQPIGVKKKEKKKDKSKSKSKDKKAKKKKS